MNAQAAVPLVVLSPAAEPVQAVNSILRRAGQAAHCTWIPSLPDLADAMTQINPELLLLVGSDHEAMALAARVRDQTAPEVPLIAVSDLGSEDEVAEAMRMGARDVVSLSSPARLEAVVLRELRSFRLERALNNTLQSARDYRRQLENVLERSNDAIAQVQDGIILEVNDSWIELFGARDRAELVGQPLMDFFAADSHAALRGALSACASGRWNDHGLQTQAVHRKGRQLPLELMLAPCLIDEQPAVRLMVPARRRDESQLALDLADAVRRDPATGFLHRRATLEAMRERVATAASGGVRFVAQVRIDKFAAIEREVGLEGSEQVLVAFASLLQSAMLPKDIGGRFGGVSFLVLLERGNAHDAEAWAEQLVERVRAHAFNVGSKPCEVTCSVGLGVVPAGNPDIGAAIDDALDACRRARKRGGNQTSQIDRADTDSRVLAYDQVWVKHIRAALLENRFRLLQQPIASLQGDDLQMFDLMVRMLDTQGRDVLPSEFMPAAERNGLLRSIDRWVIGATLSLAAQHQSSCLFVRLSQDTVLDGSAPDWLDGQLHASRAQAGKVCFQVPEQVAEQHPQAVQALAQAIKRRGLRFALERFGSGRDPSGLLQNIPLDFVKIDGALVQSLASSPATQAKISNLVDLARSRKVLTVAERVEDANTMAVLFQLGVQFVQGYFINEPEQIVLGS